MKRNEACKCKHVPENQYIIGFRSMTNKKIFFVNPYTQKCKKCGQPIEIKHFQAFRACIAVFFILLLLSAYLVIDHIAAYEDNGARVNMYYSALYCFALAGVVVWFFGYRIACWRVAVNCYYESNDVRDKTDPENTVIRHWPDRLKQIAVILLAVAFLGFGVYTIIDQLKEHGRYDEDFVQMTLADVDSIDDMIARYPDKPYVRYPNNGYVYTFVLNGDRYLNVNMDDRTFHYFHTNSPFFEYFGNEPRELSDFDGAETAEEVLALTPDQPYIVYSDTLVFVYENDDGDYVNIVCDKETGRVADRFVSEDVRYSPIAE